MAKIYISSTYEDLKDHREAAYKALRRLGHDLVAMEDYVATDERPLDRCLADVAACDAYVGVIGWRYGFVPPQDNPDKRSITELEYRRAVELKKPRLLFMVADDAAWPPKFVDRGEAADRLKALRDDLGTGRLASFFASKEQLAELVTAAVVRWERGKSVVGQHAQDARDDGPGSARLLGADPPQPYPDAPYPLLQPYDHPATFGGRDRELNELERCVRAPQLVLCVHAPSGAGKSSLLRAGLVPRLRNLGYPVTIDWHPAEPGLARRIISGLFSVPVGFDLRDDDASGLARWIAEARRQAGGKPAVIIVDQVDDALRLRDGGSDALARLGPLMAATAQHFDGRHGYPCRWVLCYRHEFHGVVDKWLEDVLRQARARKQSGLETLPYNLSGPDRFHSWVLPVLGTPPPGDEDGVDSATRAFLDAIERPLTLPPRPDGRQAYDVRFEGDGAKRLGDAFARARARDADAPLVPELQVVLAHLLDGARAGTDGIKVVQVPESADELDRRIDEALTAHLRRALEEAFPIEAGKEAAGQARARALLALRELADAHGRRGSGLTRERLAEAIGPRGETIIDELASPRVRLIVQEKEGRSYTLSHDRMAQVVMQFVEQDEVRRFLAADERLIELRRFVERRSELWTSKDPSTLHLERDRYRRIDAFTGALLWSEDHRRWWDACVRHRQRRSRQMQWACSVAAIVLTAAVWFGWRAYDRRQTELACGEARFSRSMWCLPDEPMLGFVEIPAGSFLMGSDKTMDKLPEDDEVWPGSLNGQGSVNLDAFYIGKFEVTVGQFRSFVEQSGHKPAEGGSTEGRRNDPVVNVTWHDAVAFAAWLDEALKKQGPDQLRRLLNDTSDVQRRWRVSLPSEAEWEKAARGTDGRTFPWGEGFQPDRANSFGLRGGVTPVGSFLRGASPFGVLDMAGNVGEWTRSAYKPYPYVASDGREDLQGNDPRVRRGGWFNIYGGDVRAASRSYGNPGDRNDFVGFRVVVSRS